jgi:flagellar protein FliT
MATAMAMEAILQVSTQMLTAARAGDWDGVTAQGVERSRLLERLPVDDPAMINTLKTLLAHNEEIRGLAGEAREGASRALNEHQHRHRALSAYLHAGID